MNSAWYHQGQSSSSASTIAGMRSNFKYQSARTHTPFRTTDQHTATLWRPNAATPMWPSNCALPTQAQTTQDDFGERYLAHRRVVMTRLKSLGTV